MRYALAFFLSALAHVLCAQPLLLKGVVRDSLSKQPLAFVSLQVQNRPDLAAMTDIDGRFSIEIPGFPVSLKFSYVGYRQNTVSCTGAPAAAITVWLVPVSLELKAVQIRAGENPAHRIIRTTWNSRNKHDPSALKSYRCKTYSKLILTGRNDTAWVADQKEQVAKKQRADSLFSRQHLFLIESYSTRYFKNNRAKEIVNASRVSGMKEASVFMLALQYQPFTFYEPLVEVSGKKYVNPVSRNSESLYFFSLEDTLFRGNDSIYVIRYKPLKNKEFDALTGILYISAPDYAIQNVIAEPARSEGAFSIRIQQQYARLDNGRWFPEQLNTDLRFLNISIPGNKVVGESRIYVSGAEINPEISNKIFDEVSLEVEGKAAEQTETYWDSVRTELLNEQEKRTYRVVDSLSKAQHLELRLKVVESVARGYFPFKSVDLDISRIIAYNQHEGYRLGLGGLTNDRLSKRFGIGGYFAYGFRDRRSKFKTEAKWYLTVDRDFYLGISWLSDVFETGGIELVNDRRPMQTESIRNLLVGRMHREERSQAEAGFRIFKYLSGAAFLRQSHSTALFDYRFRDDLPEKRYSWLESGVSFRLAWREAFYQSGNLKLSMGTRYPIVFAQVMYGHDQVMNGLANFLKVDLRAEKTISTRRWGQSHIQLLAGMIEGDVPAMRLYTGRSNLLAKDRLRVSSFNTFETMLMNQVLMNRYAALFLQQDLGSFFSIRKWRPAFSVVQNSMWGTLALKDHHQLIETGDASNGFFEAGLKISGLLRYSFQSYGAGAFYRFGPFADADWRKNVLLKLNIGFVF